MKQLKQKNRVHGFALASWLLLLNISSLQAQAEKSNADHHQAQPLVKETPSSDMPVVPLESKKKVPTAQDTSVENDNAMQMDGGDMQGMQMDGMEASTEMRDPHAYSAGHTLEQGPYALPGPRQLILADEHSFWSILGERLEYNQQSQTANYDLQGWLGTSYDRLVIKAEGDVADNRISASQTELLWGHAISSYWDQQLGIRIDTAEEGSDRQWLAFGIQGLAPYWFELNVTGYIGNGGRSALWLTADYELMLTQRLILQPRAELSLYGKDDAINRLGSGLTDANFGLRLRYEFSRQFAPYAGIEWAGKFGKTAEYAELSGESDRETRYVVGMRFWF